MSKLTITVTPADGSAPQVLTFDGDSLSIEGISLKVLNSAPPVTTTPPVTTPPAPIALTIENQSGTGVSPYVLQGSAPAGSIVQIFDVFVPAPVVVVPPPVVVTTPPVVVTPPPVVIPPVTTPVIKGVWTNVTPAGINLDPAMLVVGGQNFNYGAQEVVVDPVNPLNAYTSFTYQGIWASKDAGQNWSKITSGKDAMDNGRPSMAIAPDGSYILSTLLYPINGFSNGCWKSVAPVKAGDPALGTSWRLINIPGVPNGGDMSKFQIDPANAKHVIGQPHTFTGSFYESNDAGETWTAQPLPAGSVVRVHLVDSTTLLAGYDWGSGVNPQVGTKSGTTWTWAVTIARNEAGTAVAGQTSYHGEQQIFVDTVNKVAGRDVIYVGGPEGVQRSVDGGGTWTKLSTPVGDSEGLVATPTTIYSTRAFASGGGFSPNFMTAPRVPGFPGSTWKAGTTPAGMTNGWLSAGVTFDGSNYIIIAGCWNAGIWRYVE